LPPLHTLPTHPYMLCLPFLPAGPPPSCVSYIGFGQDHIYSVYTVFWQGNHRIYGHIRCIYTVLANPTDMLQISQASWLSVSLANVLCACVAVLSVPVRGPPLAKTASVLTYIYNEVCVCVCNVMLGLLFNSFVVAHPFAFISHWLTLFCAHVVAMSRARLLFIPSVAFISPHWLTLLCAQVVAMSRARLGLYIVGRQSLFANCFELQPVFK